MERATILKEVNSIFTDVSDNEGIVLNDGTSAGDVAEWDSLSHIQLVVAIEKHFKVKFTSAEIQKWKNVGELIDAIHSKVA